MCRLKVNISHIPIKGTKEKFFLIESASAAPLNRGFPSSLQFADKPGGCHAGLGAFADSNGYLQKPPGAISGRKESRQIGLLICIGQNDLAVIFNSKLQGKIQCRCRTLGHKNPVYLKGPVGRDQAAYFILIAFSFQDLALIDPHLRVRTGSFKGSSVGHDNDFRRDVLELGSLFDGILAIADHRNGLPR